MSLPGTALVRDEGTQRVVLTMIVVVPPAQP